MTAAATTIPAIPAALPPELFTPIERCRICDGTELGAVGTERLDFAKFLTDPDIGPVLGDYDGYRFALNRCRTCGFMQPGAFPSRPGFFDALYNLKWVDGWMEQEFTSGYKDTIFRVILASLRRRLGVAKDALLDVGCHVGRMPELARQAGWQAEGIELNPRTAAFAARRTGLPIHRKNAKDLAASGSRYDAVVLTDVLEHIPDPLPLLADLRGLLNPGGWVAIKVPCGINQLRKQRIRHALNARQDPGIATNLVHINHFGPRSLASALGRAGFDAVQVGVGAPELPPDGGLKGSFKRMFRMAVFAGARWMPFGTYSPLTMNLQAYARNPLG